jgi:DNA-binding MurR/RpiR family transcriptional regulator
MTPYDSLKERLVERRGTLPPRLAQIASYALDKPGELALGTVASIAAAANVQPSSLVRFAKTMGYGGFSDLQEIFRQRLRGADYEQRLERLREHGSKPSMILQGFAEAAKASLVNLQSACDPAQLDSAVTLLAKAETIYLIGLKRSFPVAAYLAYAFGKLSIRNILAGGFGANELQHAASRDAVLAVSFTPYASETVALANAAVAQGVPLVAITDSAFSPLAQSAAAWLEAAEADFEGFRSLSATMTLAMTLAVAVAEQRKQPEPRVRVL